jgi:hypothetical protein
LDVTMQMLVVIILAVLGGLVALGACVAMLLYCTSSRKLHQWLTNRKLGGASGGLGSLFAGDAATEDTKAASLKAPLLRYPSAP